MYDILLLNQAVIPKSKNEKTKGCLSYCEKALSVYASIDTDHFDE